MRQEEINSLIRKVLSHSASQEEIQRVEEWRNATPRNAQIFKVLQQVWQERSFDPAITHFDTISQQIWDKGMAENGGYRRRNTFFKRYAKIAAVVAFLLLPGGILLWTTHHNSHMVLPTEIVQKINPAGQKSKLFLPDGSIVWLNAESTLTYPVKFSDSLRWVKLEGEAYFEVAKDARKPFTVQSGEIRTTALGTSFNISAYAEDEALTVALITGKVKIEQDGHKDNILLEAGKGFQFNRNHQQQVFQIQEDKVLAWKLGILTFEGDSFEQVVKKIQRWYGVAIRIEGVPPTDWKLTGRFENEYLIHVIETIQFGRQFDYKIDNNTLTFNFN